MKIQIARLAPHQNAKVVGILSGLGSLLLVFPMIIVFSFSHPGVDAQGHAMAPPPVWIFLIFPVIYLAMGYIMAFVACVVYNFMFKYIGGIEYESKNP